MECSGSNHGPRRIVTRDLVRSAPFHGTDPAAATVAFRELASASWRAASGTR